MKNNTFFRCLIVFIIAEDTLLDRAQTSLVYQRLNHCRVLQRNFSACVDAAQVNLDPARRRRYNEPSSSTPETPHARDLGVFTRIDISI